MQRFVLRLVVTALAVLAASALASNMGGLIEVRDFESVLLFSLVLGLLNAFLRPILLLLTLPLTLLTLGLFTFVVNAIVFWLAAQLPIGVHVRDFWSAFLGAIVVSVVSFFASRIIR